LDESGVKGNLRYFRSVLGLDGIFCNGLIGEVWALTLRERKRIHELVTEESSSAFAVSILVNHHTLSETVDLARHAARAGSDYVAIMNPAVGPRSDEAIYRYFRTICDAVNSPVILFNTPVSGYCMSPRLIARIVEAGNVVGLKTTGPERATAVVRSLCPKLIVSDPLEAHWLRNLKKYGQKVLYADPEPYLFQTAGSTPIFDYTKAARRGDWRSAQNIYRALAPIRRIYDRWIMALLEDGRMPNAALKIWSRLMGLSAGPVRPPLIDLSDRDRQNLTASLANCLPRKS
jgi:4-hydroxy-tetrahydrodipicolinate synthase